MSHQNHYLYPGMLFADQNPHLVTTVLGSCIAVCFWDKKNGVGGMNHFILPYWSGKGLPTPKFGNVAIEKLLHRVRELSDGTDEIVAKVFGGASMWGNPEGSFSVGDRNVKLARQVLAEQSIKVVSSDLGGNQGRKIIFDTQTGKVLLKRNEGLAYFRSEAVVSGAGEVPKYHYLAG